MDDANRIVRRPVLLVSGFGCVPPVPGIFRDYEKAGHPVSIAPWTMLPTYSFESYAAAIGFQAERLAERSPDETVHLVCHSLGGVSALYAVKRFGLAANVRSFVACGSPFQGALMTGALIGTGFFSVIGIDGLPGSRFLRDLHADPLPSDIRFVSIGGSDDFICPLKTNRLAGAEHVLLPHHHWHYLIDRGFNDYIRANLL